ncbi:hypothetical protein ACFE04_021967 [Oxalis oulophora]
MEEALSPRQRGIPIPNYHVLQSPTANFFLRSNDDQLERAKARAEARAAAIRRTAMANAPPPPSPCLDDTCLTQDHIIELFQNCIKLASENKINQKNTWELKLIDHLSQIIKVDTAQGDTETNFQKASCTLEAGVKIYSARVDSVHAEAYRVLSGMHRAGQEDDQVLVDNIISGQEGGQSKKETEKKISPLSTLESSFEALNVKKFDIAFAVDPLYHQTSAQFDEGGAKGLLLNNLGVYEGCRVLFDSFEVPGTGKSRACQNNNSDMIDLSFAKESIEQMAVDVLRKNEICPNLKDIISLLDEDDERAFQKFPAGEQFDFGADPSCSDESNFNKGSFENHDSWTFDHDEETSVDESFSFSPAFPGHHEETNLQATYEPDVDDKFETVTTYLFEGLGLTLKQNAWAGPDHWKYQKLKENTPTVESVSEIPTKNKNTKTKNLDDLDFMKSLGKDMHDIFAPPKNPKSLLSTINRVPSGNRLPEDCHYQPENLVKLFLLPNILCLGKKRGRKFTDTSSWQQNDAFDETMPSMDNQSVVSDQFDDGYIPDNMEHPDELVSQPRQVNKIDVEYDKTAKQVDVHVLKETLWDRMHELVKDPETVHKDEISFKQVLTTFPVDCRAAAAKDISPHLCFICLLHLANEHGLTLQACPTFDDIHVQLPSSVANNTFEPSL